MFETLAKDGTARRGRLTTRHGVVETPVFMPVGTYGSVKGVTPTQIKEIGTQILLGNTFHLMLRPGDESIAQLGGALASCARSQKKGWCFARRLMAIELR